MNWLKKIIQTVKNFYKRAFGSTFVLKDYLLEKDIPSAAQEIADGLVRGQKKFDLLFDALSCFDAEELKRNANRLADEVSQLTRRDVKFKDGECLGGKLITLYFTL